MLIHPQFRDDAGLRATVDAMARNTGPEAFVRQQTAITMRIDSRPSLINIDCPTLVLCGRDDQLTPVDRHQEIATAIRAARLVVIERCGHLSTLERPQPVNEALRSWLQWN
jgi:pimeloyl-ACP methyl ester carboxylesterase